jgi:hypothetical protein
MSQNNDMPARMLVVEDDPEVGEIFAGFTFIYVLPLTGWWGPYKYWRKKP